MGKYRHLTREDREQIAIMRAAGCANGAIASSIGKSPATISRELHRNSLASGRYSANVADGAYMERRQRSARLERDANLAAFVRQRLSEAPSRRLQAIVCRATGSPQQISGWLRSGAEPRFGAMAMETIYSFIYRTEQKSEELWRYLARRRKKRRALRSRPARDLIKDRVSIHDRPDEVGSRSTLGHWPYGDASIACRLTGRRSDHLPAHPPCSGAA